MSLLRTILRIFNFSIVVTLAAIWFLILGPTYLGGPATYIMISGLSMEPTLHDRDLAILHKQATYQQGDIIAFRVPGGNVIHRIVGGSASDAYITQGDNKDSIDPWQPMPEDVLGKLWLHIPGGGRILQNLRQPQILVALGGLAALMLMEDPKKPGKKSRKKRGAMGGSKITISGISAPLHYLLLLGASALAAFSLLALGVYSFLQPLEKSEQVTRLRYDHVAAFQYAMHTEPSVLYPQSLIGPIDAYMADKADVPPVFTRLAHSIDLDFSYNLNVAQTADLNGELTPMLRIKAGEAWSRTTPIGSPVQFTGTSASTRMTLDFAEVHALIETVKEQTGFNAGTYEVALVPSVHLIGSIGQEIVDDIYEPAFNMQINDTRIGLDPELSRSETRTIAEQVTRPQEINLIGLAVPVAIARVLSVSGGIISLAVTAGVFAFIFLGLGGKEADQIQARYGGMLVSVSSVDLQASQTVQVASMGDLVRLAQRDGRAILHQELDKGVHLYFLPDSQIIYTYPVVERVHTS